MQSLHSHPNNYQRIDHEIEALNSETGVSSDVCLPPFGVLIDNWIVHLPQHLREVVESRVALLQSNPDHELRGTLSNLKFHDLLRCPEQLLTTVLQSRPSARQTHVTIQRTLSEPADIHGNLAQIIWNNDGSSEAILSMADVVFVAMRRVAGVGTNKWQFDEEVILDRYMADNIAWATQLRAQEHLVKTDQQRLQDQIDALSTFRGQSLPDALAALVKELEHDSERDGRADIKHELERVAEVIGTKLNTLKSQAEEMQTNINEGLFATDDEERCQHRYGLRAVLWHDGFSPPVSRLYSYVHWKANWWKIEDLSITKVDFETIQNDNTGAFTDGGPYLLIYSRLGPRPHGHSREEQQAAEEDNMDIESTAGSTDTLPTARRMERQPDLLMENDEGIRLDGDSALAESKPRPQLPRRPSSISAAAQVPLSPTSHQEVDMRDDECPEDHHALTVDDKNEWEVVEDEEHPRPVHAAT
ncbi:hypothetical protein CC85DRAFT_287130 [Cutaneotrichosporon oleaginosum]|uniref:Peptidase C19 ubiquitin carboxyl-terminal hydrolase domain-containing protein n=1 Tax=Cutaneotrichosporon oleaginosum TaxID=879819 RepID=A0A0J0XI93_9TREE|nr:uncharacterized protein CC85DRAFT_287130 [Cutaneotrichosporon oleaginosum]KLT40732.1 hypothetical protein CC85DRAFT_287130 [Cutaneotrichosporon oleaginosum]TXT06812.1 hypothetical protein COLE_06143 [Cutaneotrichosporon oleaginosum]